LSVAGAPLYPGAVTDKVVFISFASKDRAVAMTICEALEHRGIDCWISTRDILPGENFQTAIVRAIRAAKVMLLVFSNNSNNSEEIKKEVALAGQSRLVVIPVRVEDVTPNEAFAYEFATRQWIDLFSDWERELHNLVVRIETVVRDNPDAKVATAGDAIEASPRSTRHSGSGVPQGPPKSRRALISRSLVIVLAVTVVLLGLRWLLVKVPRLPPGVEYVRAERILQRTGLAAEKASVAVDDGQSAPRVFDQEPAAGSIALRGTTVRLTLIRQYIFPLVCRGGGAFGAGHGQSSDGDSRLLRFERNLIAKASLDLKPGECSWTDRPMWSTEPDAMLASDEEGIELADALRLPSKVVSVCVYNEQKRPRFIVVHHEDYESFVDGQWKPKAVSCKQ
jgi:hypothetical protein